MKFPIQSSSLQLPDFNRIWPDLAAFIAGLGLAWYLQWQTTDLVWSLWLCSLVVGYLTLLSTLATGAIIGIHAIRTQPMTGRDKRVAFVVGSGFILALLIFFSFHFCGFHAGHAVFLSSFFPLEKLTDNDFGSAFMNPILLWKIVCLNIIPAYGFFLIPAILSERRNVFAALKFLIPLPQPGQPSPAFMDFMSTRDRSINPFTRPYFNVIRMHILIFFFAFCHLAKIDSSGIYAVVYFVYFFPWRAFQKDSSTSTPPP